MIGLEASVKFSDREKMPYVSATINEVQRMSTLGMQSIHKYIKANIFFLKSPSAKEGNFKISRRKTENLMIFSIAAT